VSVKDNGAGIPRDKLDSIFDMFMQVDLTLAMLLEVTGNKRTGRMTALKQSRRLKSTVRKSCCSTLVCPD
jgi:hypothetical protein